jgi:hypothetical protein
MMEKIMLYGTGFVFLVVVMCGFAMAEPKQEDIEFTYSPQSLLDSPIAEINSHETISLDGLAGKDQKAALTRLQELPKLTEIKFYNCDLSKVDSTDPIPLKVKTVLLAGGKISQSTLRWLAKFPAGTELVFGGYNLQGLDLKLGKFSWVTVDNCKISRACIMQLVGGTTQATFKEVTIVEDR